MSAAPRNIEQDKKRVQEDKDFTSTRMSDVTRYIGFGLSALTLALLTSSSNFATELIETSKWFILLSSFFGCLAIFFDYLHYYFGYKSDEEAYQNIRRYELRQGTDIEDFKLFDVTSFNYRARRFFFTAKHFSVFVGMLIFITVLLFSLTR